MNPCTEILFTSVSITRCNIQDIQQQKSNAKRQEKHSLKRQHNHQSQTQIMIWILELADKKFKTNCDKYIKEV